jgi:hypothetical protein
MKIFIIYVPYARNLYTSYAIENIDYLTTIDGVITSTVFSSILFNFFYYNYSSNYITEPYSRYYGRSCY